MSCSWPVACSFSPFESVGCFCGRCSFSFFFNDPATTEIYTLSLHDALPILGSVTIGGCVDAEVMAQAEDVLAARSEEHTSELQSLTNLVCRLLLEKKKTEEFSNRDDQRRNYPELSYHQPCDIGVVY